MTEADLHEANRAAHRVAKAVVEERRIFDITVEEKIGFGALVDAQIELNTALDEYERLCGKAEE